jgi:hypothetical protein
VNVLLTEAVLVPVLMAGPLLAAGCWLLGRVLGVRRWGGAAMTGRRPLLWLAIGLAAALLPVGLAVGGALLWQSGAPDEEEPFWTQTTVSVPAGGVLEVGYSRMADSGVHLVRRGGLLGRQVWEHWCRGLGVTHSEYQHDVTVRVEGPVVRVTSRGSDGTFVERLDLATGTRLGRVTRMDNGATVAAEPVGASDRGGTE